MIARPVNRRAFLRAAGSTAALTGTGHAAPGREVSVGFLGVGSRGSFLLRNVLQVEGAKVRAVCDISPERQQGARKLILEAGQGDPQLYEDWKKMLDKAPIEAVISALPCHLHAAAYLDCIAAHKDLYGEKPMCITRTDCDRVVAAAARGDQVVQIGFQRRADPRYVETIGQVHNGELGDLIEGRILWSNAWGPLYGWFGHRKESGDWIVEQAVHAWDVMNWVNQGLPKRAMGMGRSDLFRDKQPDRDVHDYYAGVVEYENGVIVNIVHSWVSPGKLNEDYVRLVGTRGGVDFNTGMFSYRRDLKKPDRPGHTYSGEINNTLLALQAFIDSIRSRKAPIANAEHGRNAVRACLLVREAVYRQTVVSMSEIRA